MIVSALYFLLLAGDVLVTLAVAIVVLETIAAIALPKRTLVLQSGISARARIGVLVPAHDEEAVIHETVINIQRQLQPGDRLLVVADNCSDGTAAVAEGLGADVIVRTDPVNRGKGFALDRGIRQFANDPPEIVIVIDADCTLEDFAIDRLASTCEATRRPVQALDLMKGGPDSTQSTRVREFAWRVKNWIRPLGLNSAGLPCQLMGTGMAFPWEIIASANLATGGIVEDLKLGLELTAEGHPPIFCPAAVVTSEFPTTGEGNQSQQLRWEGGHLGVIATDIPQMFWKAVGRADVNLLVLALDAAVPPLSLLWISVLLFLVLSFGAWLMGMGSAALVVSLGSFAGFALATTICWLTAGRDLLSLKSVFSVGATALKKIPLYFRIISRRSGNAWVRTDRRKS